MDNFEREFDRRWRERLAAERKDRDGALVNLRKKWELEEIRWHREWERREEKLSRVGVVVDHGAGAVSQETAPSRGRGGSSSLLQKRLAEDLGERLEDLQFELEVVERERDDFSQKYAKSTTENEKLALKLREKTEKSDDEERRGILARVEKERDECAKKLAEVKTQLEQAKMQAKMSEESRQDLEQQWEDWWGADGETEREADEVRDFVKQGAEKAMTELHLQLGSAVQGLKGGSSLGTGGAVGGSGSGPHDQGESGPQSVKDHVGGGVVSSAEGAASNDVRAGTTGARASTFAVVAGKVGVASRLARGAPPTADVETIKVQLGQRLLEVQGRLAAAGERWRREPSLEQPAEAAGSSLVDGKNHGAENSAKRGAQQDERVEGAGAPGEEEERAPGEAAQESMGVAAPTKGKEGIGIAESVDDGRTAMIDADRKELGVRKETVVPGTGVVGEEVMEGENAL